MHRRSIVLSMLLAAIVAGGGLYAWYRTDLADAERRIASGSSIAETAAGPVEFAATGTGEAVLILHGSGGGFDQGLLIADQILPPGYRAVAPSRFGYLRTPLADDPGAESQAAAHAALLDSLGIGRAAVAGISAGTPSAIAFARVYPERTAALILISPAIFSAERPTMEETPGNRLLLSVVMQGSDFIFWLLKRFAYSTVISFLGVDPKLYAAAPAADRAEMDRIVDAVMPLGRRLPGMLNDGAVIEAADPYRLHELTAPVLLICARDDLLADCNEAERIFRDGEEIRLAVFESGGHLLLGRWGEARESLQQFLAQAQGPGRRN